jgi:hypothetical protein
LSTAIPSFGAHVKNPVRGFDNFQIMLDDDHGIPLIDQRMEDLKQLLDIGKMQARGRLIENIHGTACRTP